MGGHGVLPCHAAATATRPHRAPHRPVLLTPHGARPHRAHLLSVPHRAVSLTWQLPSARAPQGLCHALATGLTSVTPSFSVPSRTLREIPGLELGAWIFPLRGDSRAVTPLLHFPSF